jgi:hypothetical protein
MSRGLSCNGQGEPNARTACARLGVPTRGSEQPVRMGPHLRSEAVTLGSRLAFGMSGLFGATTHSADDSPFFPVLLSVIWIWNSDASHREYRPRKYSVGLTSGIKLRGPERSEGHVSFNGRVERRCRGTSLARRNAARNHLGTRQDGGLDG